MAMIIRVALIGNPNVGKSLIFNNLTGGRAHVGNWPGKTVEKKVGRCRHKGVEMEIVDLPGVYSLAANSVDEIIARDYIIEEKPDVVVDIVDATNLERNLYLTLQLLELEANVVVALNKWDVANDLGYEIDVGQLSRLLGVPVVPTVATTKEGMEELKDAIIEAARKKGRKSHRRPIVDYGPEVERAIRELEAIIRKDAELAERYPTRWLAIRLLEGDEDLIEKLKSRPIWSEISEAIGWREN